MATTKNAENGTKRINFSADEETVRLLKRAQKIAEKLTGRKLSSAIILRRAIRQLWLHYVHKVHQAATHPDPDAGREMGQKLIDIESTLLGHAAKGYRIPKAFSPNRGGGA